jgi:hypothetical protein
MLQKYRICGALARQMLVNELNYRLNQLNLGGELLYKSVSDS